VQVEACQFVVNSDFAVILHLHKEDCESWEPSGAEAWSNSVLGRWTVHKFSLINFVKCAEDSIKKRWQQQRLTLRDCRGSNYPRQWPWCCSDWKSYRSLFHASTPEQHLQVRQRKLCWCWRSTIRSRRRLRKFRMREFICKEGHTQENQCVLHEIWIWEKQGKESLRPCPGDCHRTVMAIIC
jgi:hypothetical protein